MDICTIEVSGRRLSLSRAQYRGGAVAIRVLGDQGEQWGVLTVNLPGVPLAQDEVLVKTWSENKLFRAPALASGKLVDTGRRIPTGFVQAEVWKIVG